MLVFLIKRRSWRLTSFFSRRKNLLLLTLLLFSQANAQVVKTNECLQMHVIQSVPIGYYDENGELIGVHTEMLEAIERYSGLCFEKLLMPIARIVKSLSLGQHDGGILLLSEKRAHLTTPVEFITNIQTIVIPRRGVRIEKYEDLHSLILGKIGGMPISNDFDSDKELVLVQANRYGQAAQMLERGRVDALAGGAAPLYHNLSKIPGIEQTVDISNIFVLGQRAQWLQLAKNSKHLDKTEILQKAIGVMKENGDYQRIQLKYYGTFYHRLIQQHKLK